MKKKNAASLPPRRACPTCGHRHFATVCHICKKPALAALLRFAASIDRYLSGGR